jgi:tetratricopeptide (TPR) repeat protein
MVEEAQLHAGQGAWAKVEPLARRVTLEASLPEPHGPNLLAEALHQLGRTDEARQVLEAALKAYPRHASLQARLAGYLLEADQVDAALELFARARPALKREPTFLTHSALAFLRAGRTVEAESDLAAALLQGGGPDTKLVLAMARGRRGAYEEADALCSSVEAQAGDSELGWSARSMRAECRLMLNDAAGALERWKVIEAAGRLDRSQLGHMAYAAQVVGEPGLADTLMARCATDAPTAEDRLLFAQIGNLRHQPDVALEHLAAAATARGERFPGFDSEVLAARGRSLRLLGRRDEARAALQEALDRPEATNRRLGPRVRVDLGHLAAELGDFEAADAHFAAALELDPGDPEAVRARELTRQRLVWRETLSANAEAQVAAARAEADALQRRFRSREGELEALRQELERMKAQQASTEEKARRAEEAAREAAGRAEREQRQRLREELELREREADEKARGNLERALGDARARCPEALWQMLLVAERTYQKALYTELPAAAVAVLFSGALERGLFMLFVSRFEDWLTRTGRRQAFLEGAVRERRGRHVEYLDRFVAAFDTELELKAPALGEVGRVLEKLDEPHLAPFKRFLSESYEVPADYYARLARFVVWSKEKLRDPVAHGRAIELGYEELKTFRETLLFGADGGPGLLVALLRGQRAPSA